MRIILLGVATVSIAAGLLAATPAAAQADGERVCQADGKVYRWSSYRRGWVDTYVDCAPGSASPSSNRRDNDGYGSRDMSGGTPIPGEQRCGPDGTILRYDGSANRWVRTFRDCQ